MSPALILPLRGQALPKPPPLPHKPPPPPKKKCKKVAEKSCRIVKSGYHRKKICYIKHVTKCDLSLTLFAEAGSASSSTEETLG